MSRRLGLLAAFLAILVPLAFAADLAVTSFCRVGGLPGDLRKLVELAEVFGHGAGVACILLTVVVLDRARLRALPRLVACAFGAGLAANVVKMVVIRARPRVNEFSSVWETFQGWFPLFTSESLGKGLDSSLQAFPSAHTATAVGLAVALGALYPRGRWLFAFFAALAALQRIESCAHFLSDVIAGAAIGCLVAAICHSQRSLGRWFDRIERVAAENE